MVTLDERSEKLTGRSYEETLETLLELIEDKPAAVFWQCPKGKDVLYKHLRGINMVMLPKSSLPIDEQEFVEGDQASALFRHADANVLAQTLFAMTATEAARFYGPARRLLFAPEENWRRDIDFALVDWSESWPSPKPGMLTLSEATMKRLEKARESGLKEWTIKKYASQTNSGADQENIILTDAYERAKMYKLDQLEDIWKFVEMDIQFGPRFELTRKYADAERQLRYFEFDGSARLHNAERACQKISQGGLQ